MTPAFRHTRHDFLRAGMVASCTTTSAARRAAHQDCKDGGCCEDRRSVLQVPAEKLTRGVPAGTAILLQAVQFRPTRDQTRAELIGQRPHRRDGPETDP